MLLAERAELVARAGVAHADEVQDAERVLATGAQLVVLEAVPVDLIVGELAAGVWCRGRPIGFEERRVTLAEREAKALIAVFDAVRDAAELSLAPAQRRVWDVVVSRVIGEITDGGNGNGAT